MGVVSNSILGLVAVKKHAFEIRANLLPTPSRTPGMLTRITLVEVRDGIELKVLFLKSKSQLSDFFKNSSLAKRNPPVTQIASERRLTNISFRRSITMNV
jgi:hypothetical protein